MRTLLAVLLLLSTGCTKTQAVSPASGSPEPDGSPSSARPAGVDESRPHVVFPDGFRVQVEIAADDAQRAEGLMYRTSLRPDQGMLFFFVRDELHSFWMKNTLIPLDMIFLDANRRIVGIERDVPPCRVANCPSYGPGVESRYVLEVGGGIARQHGLKPGDTLRFAGVDHIVPR